jgi:hypothetical protein
MVLKLSSHRKLTRDGEILAVATIISAAKFFTIKQVKPYSSLFKTNRK